MKRPQNGVAVGLLAAWILLVLPSSSRAHALGAEAKLKDGRVHVESFYDDDTAAANAHVWVRDENKKTIAEGRMDHEGRWSFPAPAPGKYRVIVDTGGGHRASVTVTIPPGAPSPSTDSAQPTTAETEGTVVSDGKSRAEFTTFPWQGLGIGVGLIVMATVIAPRLSRALRKSNSAESPPEKTS